LSVMEPPPGVNCRGKREGRAGVRGGENSRQRVEAVVVAIELCGSALPLGSGTATVAEQTARQGGHVSLCSRSFIRRPMRLTPAAIDPLRVVPPALPDSARLPSCSL